MGVGETVVGLGETVGSGVGLGETVGAGVGSVVGLGETVGAGVGHACAPSPRSQQPVVPHGATRLLPFVEHDLTDRPLFPLTSQRASGNVPEIWFRLRYLRRRGRSRGAPGVGDAGGTRRFRRFVSWPSWGGIGPLILFP